MAIQSSLSVVLSAELQANASVNNCEISAQLSSGYWTRRWSLPCNHPAAQTHLAVVQHRALARRDGPLRLGKVQRKAVFRRGQRTSGVLLAVARFGGVPARRGRVAGAPAGVLRAELVRQQPRVVVALHHAQDVFFHLFARDKPRRVLAAAALRAFFFDAANAQPLALAQRVKAQADMLAEFAPALVLNRSGRVGDVAV